MANKRLGFGALLVCLSIVASACVSAQVTSLRKPVTIERMTPMLILVHEGTFGRSYAKELADQLDAELVTRHVQGSVWVVGPEELKDDARLRSAYQGKATALRILPVSGEKLEGVMVRLTYDVSLQDLMEDVPLWQGRLEVRSGIYQRQVRRRQRRAAHVLLDKLEQDGVLHDP